LKILLTKTPLGFIPAFDSDYEQAKKIGNGNTIEATITKKRNILFHRKYFALLKCIFHNLPEKYSDKIKNIDDLLIAIKFAIGHTKKVFGLHGEINEIPLSIDFEHMDDYKFEDIYNDTLNILCKFLGCLTEKAEKQLMEFY